MPEYDVEVCRIAYGNTTIRVTADNKAEAMEKAEEEAGNIEFSMNRSEYEAQSAIEVKRG